MRASGLMARGDVDDKVTGHKDAASDKDVDIAHGMNSTVNARMTGVSRFRNLLGGRTTSSLGDLFTRNKTGRHATMPALDDASELTDDAIGRSAWGLSRTSKSKDRAKTAVAPAPDAAHAGTMVVARKSAKEHGFSAWRRAAPLRMLAQRIVGIGQRFTSAR
ncbi:hypothetical protein SYNPS1DRAFT_28829 [Syncephalis pseudoplumigaleata]|uniref:Uncharacterized protein n=1 Tax=Syncephalis pseudoplumigaleata TaxID=1712513 RepID=A0A4P9YZQ4_9FUNG|nr:hypothetical protein SYNPS1DRAFT_28829 [Syncephalis pseudoplumigaleata]|eukprot:RKP25445.1 hypothetical protein SYNPS1DRAFT_28829 [Syncephalis pseudoplumigaleata]